jgi:hypothetical protein
MTNATVGNNKTVTLTIGELAGTAAENYTKPVSITNPTVNIIKATPVAGTDYTVPTGLTALDTQTLANVSFTDSRFTWESALTTPVGRGAPTQTHNAKFTPTDTVNYNEVTVPVTISVTATGTSTVITAWVADHQIATDKGSTATLSRTGSPRTLAINLTANPADPYTSTTWSINGATAATTANYTFDAAWRSSGVYKLVLTVGTSSGRLYSTTFTVTVND